MACGHEYTRASVAATIFDYKTNTGLLGQGVETVHLNRNGPIQRMTQTTPTLLPEVLRGKMPGPDGAPVDLAGNPIGSGNTSSRVPMDRAKRVKQILQVCARPLP